MKMETTIHAQRDGKVSEILVAVGNQISAKDLMMVVKGAAKA